MDVEELRRVRTEKAERRTARIRSWAERAEAKAAELDRQVDALTGGGDYAFYTQPVIRGHHSEKAHRSRLDRINRKRQDAMALRQKAAGYRTRAENVMRYKTRVKGDAARARQEQRDVYDGVIVVGSKVHDWAYGVGEVLRVNKRTYTISFGGWKCARDKCFVEPSK